MKEMNDVNVVDAGVKAISDFGKQDLVPHFIYCGSHYLWTDEIRRLPEIFLAKMELHGLQFAI